MRADAFNSLAIDHPWREGATKGCFAPERKLKDGVQGPLRRVEPECQFYGMVEDGIIIRRPLVIPSHGSEDMIDALPVLRSVRSNVERVHLQLVITHIEAAHAFNHEAGEIGRASRRTRGCQYV